VRAAGNYFADKFTKNTKMNPVRNRGHACLPAGTVSTGAERDYKN